MSEKHVPKHEHGESHEHHADHHEHHERIRQHHEAAAEKARAEKSRENIAKIHELAKAEAKEIHKVTHHEEVHQVQADALPGMQQELKETAYKRTLARVQQKLPKASRTFSKIVHNDTVDKVSSVAAGTVGRPSGLFGGSVCAFLGSLLVLYYSKHYGFRYNYLVLFILFAGGFLIGATLELVVWALHGRKQRY